MSIKVMTRVFDNEDIAAVPRLVLLALADHADDDGICYPSVARLARRTGLSERALQSNFKKLVSAGLLRIDKNAGPRGCNRYCVTLSPPTAVAPARADAPPQEMHPAGDAPPHIVPNTPAPGAPEPSENRQSSSSARASDEEASTLKIEDDLLDEVLAAVGIKCGRLPTYWMPPGSSIHVNRWMTDLGLTRSEIVAQARSSRQQYDEPPNGPKALDRAMRYLANAKAAARMKPATGTTGEPARTIPQPESSIPASGAFIPSELAPEKIPPADLRYADRFGISKEGTA